MYDRLKEIGEYVFLGAFSLMFIIYSVLSYRAFSRIKEMRNIFNFIQTSSIVAFLVCRIFSILWKTLDPNFEDLNVERPYKIYIFF